MEKLAAMWVNRAMKGSYPHLQAILERIYPADMNQGGTPNIILQGVRLELSPSVDVPEARARLAEYTVSPEGRTAARAEGSQQTVIQTDARDVVALPNERDSGGGEPAQTAAHAQTQEESHLLEESIPVKESPHVEESKV